MNLCSLVKQSLSLIVEFQGSTIEQTLLSNKINFKMKKRFIQFLAVVFLFSTAFTVNAQIKMARPSPNSTLKQEVGLTEVTIEYSRPGIKGRTIFAEDGLVPFGKFWRLGANSATKFIFAEDVKLGGKEVTKGEYAVLVIPGATEWKVNLYPYEKSSWSTYVEKEPTVSIMAPAVQIGATIETFLINIDNIKSSSATIDFLWESTYVAISLEVEVDSRVEKDIKRVLAGPSEHDYFNAASFYHEKGENLEQALTWIQKATSIEKPKFWHVRREAVILGDLGRYPEAIAAAKKSIDLATKAGNDDYVAMNKKSIAKWVKK